MSRMTRMVSNGTTDRFQSACGIRLGQVVAGEGDLAPDGKRFAVLVAQPARGEQRSPGGINLLLYFFDYLKQRAPVGGT